MRYLVELQTIGREVYSVEADSAADAAENWPSGDLVISETVSVEGIAGVREEDE